MSTGGTGPNGGDQKETTSSVHSAREVPAEDSVAPSSEEAAQAEPAADTGGVPRESSDEVGPVEESGGNGVSTELSAAKEDVPATGDHELLSVHIPVFEGPLDLLLHLVREHRLDIFDIPISFITEKYLEVIERMRELNLDVAGEFLVMAATLAHIKSRMLLPKPEPEEGEEEEGYEGDPRADLVRRLLEYQKYREAAGSLGAQDILNRDVFTRKAVTSAPKAEGEIGLRQVSVFRLIEALDEVLSRAKVNVSHEVVRERFSLSERLTEVLGLLKKKQRLTFTEIFEGDAGRSAIVMTFLALLEMSRLGLASIVQEEFASEIIVTATDQTGETEAADVCDDFR